jgi:hypothetical protein
LRIELYNKGQCRQFQENYQLFILKISIKTNMPNQRNQIKVINFKKTIIKSILSKLLEVKNKLQRKKMTRKYMIEMFQEKNRKAAIALKNHQ